MDDVTIQENLRAHVAGELSLPTAAALLFLAGMVFFWAMNLLGGWNAGRPRAGDAGAWRNAEREGPMGYLGRDWLGQKRWRDGWAVLNGTRLVIFESHEAARDGRGLLRAWEVEDPHSPAILSSVFPSLPSREPCFCAAYSCQITTFLTPPPPHHACCW